MADGTAGPPGFTAAVLPAAAALGRLPTLRALHERLRSSPPAADAYYDQALDLFGRGYDEGRFAFGADGSLEPARGTCPTELSRP
jgi:endoglucanase